PALYSFLWGRSCALSLVTLRSGGSLPPATHTFTSVRLRRPRASLTIADTLYIPPSLASNWHVSGLSDDTTRQSCGSTSLVLYSPPSNSQSCLTARTATSLLGTIFPSRSTTIVSSLIGSPFCRNGRASLTPT